GPIDIGNGPLPVQSGVTEYAPQQLRLPVHRGRRNQRVFVAGLLATAAGDILGNIAIIVVRQRTIAEALQQTPLMADTVRAPPLLRIVGSRPQPLTVGRLLAGRACPGRKSALLLGGWRPSWNR